MSALYERSPVLTGNLDLLAKQGARKSTRGRRPLKADRSLPVLVADLVAARAAAGMTQEEVAVSMGTAKSVVRAWRAVCARVRR
jgi:DNA-binding transcriptional regulator YiaG